MLRIRNSIFALAFVVVTLPLVAQLQGKQPDPTLPNVLVVSGANNHDWRFTSKELKSILDECGRFGDVVVTDDPAMMLADPATLKRFAAFVLDYNGKRWGEPAETNFLDAVRGGTGVVVVHAADNAFPGWVEYEKMVGLLWRKGTGHGRYHVFDVEIVDHYHPITRGMSKIIKHPDELYHHLVHMHDVEMRVLMAAYADPATGGSGRNEPMAVTLEYGEGRVFHTPLGHVWTGVPQSRASQKDPQFRLLVQRGTEWAATGAVTLSPLPANWLSPDEQAAGFQALFDGTNADQWRGYKSNVFPEYGWFIEHGTLTHESGGGGGDLITVDPFDDFDFRFEWKVEKGSNSGVIYRVTEDADASWMTGPEYQVLDDAAHGIDAKSLNGAGALYALQSLPGRVVRPIGEWNTGRIVVRGWKVEHWLNGKKVADLDLESDVGKAAIQNSKFKSMSRFARNQRGHIVLQDHGAAVWYRNLRIKEL